MIEVLNPDGTTSAPDKLTFEEIQGLVGGFVQMVPCIENGKRIHACCNEDGFAQRLPFNKLASDRFRGKINIGPAAVGVWVILSGKDLLR